MNGLIGAWVDGWLGYCQNISVGKLTEISV